MKIETRPRISIPCLKKLPLTVGCARIVLLLTIHLPEYGGRNPDVNDFGRKNGLRLRHLKSAPEISWNFARQAKWDLYPQNLMSEYHIRYGGYGGIGYYLVAESHIALFIDGNQKSGNTSRRERSDPRARSWQLSFRFRFVTWRPNTNTQPPFRRV
jgi:hypothetical protein